MFCYNILVFGLANAPFIFRRTMEQLLVDIEGTTKEVRLNRLQQVLKWLQDAELTLKQEKCVLFKKSVQ